MTQTLIYIEIIIIINLELIIGLMYWKFDAKFDAYKWLIGANYRIIGIVLGVLTGGELHITPEAIFVLLLGTIVGLHYPKVRKKMEKFKIEEKEDEQNN